MTKYIYIIEYRVYTNSSLDFHQEVNDEKVIKDWYSTDLTLRINLTTPVLHIWIKDKTEFSTKHLIQKNAKEEESGHSCLEKQFKLVINSSSFILTHKTKSSKLQFYPPLYSTHSRTNSRAHSRTHRTTQNIPSTQD